MDKTKSQFSFLLLGLDFLLLNISFFVMNYWKRGVFELSPMYVKLLIAFYFIWLIGSLFTKKFNSYSYRSYSAALLLFTKSNIFIIYCISFFVVMVGMPALSRLHVFGTCAILFVLETVINSIYYVCIGKASIDNARVVDISVLDKSRISISLIVSDFLLLTIVFFAMNYYKRGTFDLSPEYEKLLLIVYGLWLATAVITRKFEKSRFQNYIYAVAACIKAIILMTVIMSVLVFAFRFFTFSRLHIFGSFCLLIIFEPFIYRMYYMVSLYGRNDKDVESVEEVKTFLNQEKLSLEIDIDDIRSRLTEPVREKLQEKYLKDYPWLFNFIDKSLNISEIIKAETTIINSNDIFNLQAIDDHPKRLFINLHRVDNIRWINRYFLEVHKVLLNGGYFVGKAHTLSTHKKWFFKKYPKYFAEVLYVIEFVFIRVFPKVPVLKKIYFGFTKGNNRMISRAELLGRLNFCGFKIVAVKEIENRLCFIAQKVKTPSLDENPSYGPLVQLDRVGSNGQILHIYKFRTMHPYSEYLQEYVYEKNKLMEGGKIQNDFRITAWGKFMRRTFLDELPMLYNWFKGELQLVGVRPLSPHYMSLYSDGLKELRKKVKPGLVPPFYADLPETFGEICESERRYIQAFLREPLKTQWSYFLKAFYNIVVRGVRSN